MSGPWVFTAFVQGRLIETARRLIQTGTFAYGREKATLPIVALGKICTFGPYEMQIKNPTQGLFQIVETEDATRAGHPALWHHSSKRMVTLGAKYPSA